MPSESDEYLEHYASKYYDPAKAREYYLKTRKLKGRHSTKGFSEKQHAGWAYAKDKIAADKKAELAKLSDDNKARKMQLRQQAKASRERIREKLKDLVEKLKGAKGLEREKNKVISDAARLAARREIIRVSGGLKTALAKAKSDYDEIRKQTVTKYDKIKDAEYTGIKTRVPGKKKTKKKGKR